VIATSTVAGARGLAALAVSSAAALVIAAATNAPATEREPVCGPRDTFTLLQRGMIRVYKRQRGHETKTVACDAAHEARFVLDYPPFLHAFAPPAMDIRGEVLGFALNDHEDPFDQAPGTEVHVRDFSTLRSPTDRPEGSFRYADRYGRSVVGSVRVTRNRQVAWIACNEQDEFALMRYCKRPGPLAWVYRSTNTGSGRKLLDRGREIDPSSLRIAGTRLSWIHSGKRRYAELK
jgi:hypothetical protein